ncbi:MAG: hypothetical protein WA705_11910 [Candidatus Ozemobacteraceae bacterium]
MKRNFIGIFVGIVAIIIGVHPVFAQQETGKERTVSPPQKDSTPQIEVKVKPTVQIGIPPTLTAVHYRRCPIDGQRLKEGKSAVFEGKAYRFCCNNCLEKFWENPQLVVLNVKNNREAPLTITNKDGKCVCCEKPASREFCRLYRDTITFFCSSACREKETKGHRTTVSRKKNPDGTAK